MLPALFFPRIVLPIRGFLCFHANFRIISSRFLKNAFDILIEIAWNLYISLGSMVILTILILQIHELSISLHLSVSSSISFISVLYCSMYRFFTSLVRFIPRYFIHFDGIVFSIPISFFI